jgi:hypothetical protein
VDALVRTFRPERSLGSEGGDFPLDSLTLIIRPSFKYFHIILSSASPAVPHTRFIPHGKYRDVLVVMVERLAPTTRAVLKQLDFIGISVYMNLDGLSFAAGIGVVLFHRQPCPAHAGNWFSG